MCHTYIDIFNTHTHTHNIYIYVGKRMIVCIYLHTCQCLSDMPARVLQTRGHSHLSDQWSDYAREVHRVSGLGFRVWGFAPWRSLGLGSVTWGLRGLGVFGFRVWGWDLGV